MRRKYRIISILAVAVGLALMFTACGGGGGAGSGSAGANGAVQGQSSGASAPAGGAGGASAVSVASETKLVTELVGGDHAYYVAGDSHYHLYPDCTLISGEAKGGTVAQALAGDPGSSLCISCISRALSDGAAGGVVSGGAANGNTGTTGTGTTTSKPASGVVAPTAKYTAKPATVNATDGLNLRKGPGTNYDKIAGIPNKTKISDIGNSSAQPDWVYVQYGSMEGWVAKQYLKY